MYKLYVIIILCMNYNSVWSRMNFIPNVTPEIYYSTAFHPAWRLLNVRGCGNSMSDRIVGGRNATIGQFPWMARLGYSTVYPVTDASQIFFRCSGALITDYHVITAAHCVVDVQSESYLSVVRLGEYDENNYIDCDKIMCAEPAQDFFPIRIVYHQHYITADIINDIAIITLDRPIRRSRWVQTICMPFGSLLTKNLVGQAADVAGWGFYDLTVSKGSPTLRTLTVPIVSTSICKSIYSDETIDHTQLCAGGNEGQDSCDGDSGGPLMKVEAVAGQPKYFLVGIVSYGPLECGLNNTPAVYTRTTSFVPWILDNLLC